jgi:hypothetical protein
MMQDRDAPIPKTSRNFAFRAALTALMFSGRLDVSVSSTKEFFDVLEDLRLKGVVFRGSGCTTFFGAVMDGDTGGKGQLHEKASSGGVVFGKLSGFACARR